MVFGEPDANGCRNSEEVGGSPHLPTAEYTIFKCTGCLQPDFVQLVVKGDYWRSRTLAFGLPRDNPGLPRSSRTAFLWSYEEKIVDHSRTWPLSLRIERPERTIESEAEGQLDPR